MKHFHIHFWCKYYRKIHKTSLASENNNVNRNVDLNYMNICSAQKLYHKTNKRYVYVFNVRHRATYSGAIWRIHGRLNLIHLCTAFYTLPLAKN